MSRKDEDWGEITLAVVGERRRVSLVVVRQSMTSFIVLCVCFV